MVYLLIALLALGGFGIFALSTRWLTDQGSRQREAALARFAPVLAEAEAWALSGRAPGAEENQELAARTTTVAALTGLIRSTPASGAGILSLLRRVTGTLLVPAALTVLQSLL